MRIFTGLRRICFITIAAGLGFLGAASPNDIIVTKEKSAPSIPFAKLVTAVRWPRGRDGTDKSLIAYGPTAKNPYLVHSSQAISWIVDPTKVAAVDLAINGKRVDNPLDSKQPHTAIYRLGGQPIPAYTGREGYINWIIWPAGDFKFDFTVYDDAGNVIGTMSHTIKVAPMPADE